MQTKRRHRWLVGLMAMGVIVIAVRMAVPAQAQTTANGPYYATPSWDQTLPTATRFVVLSNFNSQAVLDRNTGLVWEKSPQTGFATWNDARLACINKTVGGQKGWRLPTILELTSLIDPSVVPPAPTLPPGHPFSNVQPFDFWSDSSSVDTPTSAWRVFFGNGNVFEDNKTGTSLVWCVRGGMTGDQY